MIKTDSKNQIVIYPVTPVYHSGEIEMFTTTITLREIGEMYSRLTYDGTAQRGYEINNDIKKPMIDEKHVKGIREKIEDGESIRGHLTWNIRKFEDLEDLNLEYYEFDTMKNTLTIIGNTITIPDSAHRHRAIYEIYKNDKDSEVLDSEMVLDIYNLTLEEEKQLFVSINGKGKTPNRNRVLYLSDDIKCQFIREIIEESDLNSRIEFVKNNANSDNKLTKFSTLYDSLFGTAGSYKNVKLEDEKQYDDLKTWLIKFYNELLNTRNEFDFNTSKEKREIKQQSMIVEELAWWGYAYMSKVLKDNLNWKRTLKNKMNNQVRVEGGFGVDFWSKSNPDWHGTLILYKFNPITQRAELGFSVYNANSTRKRIQDIVALRLFS